MSHFHRSGRQGYIVAFVDDGARVYYIRCITIHIADGLRHKGIGCTLMEEFKTQLKATREETGFNARIGGMGLFPLQVWISEIGCRCHHFTIISIHRSFLNHHDRSLVIQHISLFAIRRLQRQVIHPVCIHFRDALHVSITRHRPYRQQLFVATASELIGTVITGVGIQREQILVSVRQGGVCRKQVCLLVSNRWHIAAQPTIIIRIGSRHIYDKGLASVWIIPTVCTFITLI